MSVNFQCLEYRIESDNSDMACRVKSIISPNQNPPNSKPVKYLPENHQHNICVESYKLTGSAKFLKQAKGGNKTYITTKDSLFPIIYNPDTYKWHCIVQRIGGTPSSVNVANTHNVQMIETAFGFKIMKPASSDPSPEITAAWIEDPLKNMLRYLVRRDENLEMFYKFLVSMGFDEGYRIKCITELSLYMHLNVKGHTCTLRSNIDNQFQAIVRSFEKEKATRSSIMGKYLEADLSDVMVTVRNKPRHIVTSKNIYDAESVIWELAMSSVGQDEDEDEDEKDRKIEIAGGPADEKPVCSVESLLAGYKLQLTDDQVCAVRESFEFSPNIITGGPGTGKTTIIDAIICVAEKLGMRVKLLAPTGIARKNLEDKTGKKAYTIHKWLCSNESTPEISSPADMYIVDETSMVDSLLLGEFIKTMKDRCGKDIEAEPYIVFVGDDDQLSPIGPGNPFHDLLGIEWVNKKRLKKIQRQAENSNIITMSSKVRDGQELTLEDMTGDVEYYEVPVDQIERKVINIMKEMSSEEKVATQIVSPTHMGTGGVKSINQNAVIRSMVRTSICNIFKLPETEEAPGFNYMSGEKVLITKNTGTSACNGDIVYVHPICMQRRGRPRSSMATTGTTGAEGGEAVIRCNDSTNNEVREITQEAYEHKDYGYAITVHKSQGCEFETCIIVVTKNVANMLLTRKILYTASTRAKKRLVIVSTGLDTINKCINTPTVARNTCISQWKKIYEKRFK